MSNDFWDERFSQEDYVYGTKPHPLFVKAIEQVTPGRLLMAGDGEGRHAVYAAQKGFDVIVKDYSAAGKEKAIALADRNNVSIEYQVVDLITSDLKAEVYDAVGMVYAHFPAEHQAQTHCRLWNTIKKGGHLVIIGFGKEQIDLHSGGPKNIDMLYDPEELETQFAEAKKIDHYNGRMELDEGPYHQGEGHIIYYLFQKI